MATLFCVAGLLSACGGSSHPAGVKGPSEIRAEPVSMTTANPFTASVGTDKGGVTPPAAAVSSQGGAPSYSGSLPGLYGGTRNYATCDADKLVSFLEQNQAKASAWAQALAIQPPGIRDYVSSLTPVLLRTDTRVTNHGYVNGVANPIQSVLEAGTAVLVDKYGEPVVKCYCGNPLTAPQLYSAPRYYGPTWSGFQPTSITVINQSTTIIKIFTLYDPATGKLFPRRAGPWRRGSDGPYQGSQPSTSSTPTTAPPTSTPAQPAPSQPARNPTAAFSPSSGTVLDSYSIGVTGFPPNATLDVSLTRPDGGVEHYTISTGSSGTGSFAFPHVSNPAPGTYSAVVSDSTGDSASASVNVAPAPGTAPGGSGTTTT
jgi:hypothetical protein